MPVARNFKHVWDNFDEKRHSEMEGLTPEQAAQAAQWGPDVGPPGPVSWIMHIIQSQEAQEEAAISGQPSESANPAAGEGNPSPSIPTFDSVSQSTTMSTSFALHHETHSFLARKRFDSTLFTSLLWLTNEVLCLAMM